MVNENITIYRKQEEEMVILNHSLWNICNENYESNGRFHSRNLYYRIYVRNNQQEREALLSTIEYRDKA